MIFKTALSALHLISGRLQKSDAGVSEETAEPQGALP